MTALSKLDKKSISQTLCLDESTIEQSVSKAVALKMREVGAEMMDAPVSGGEAATLQSFCERPMLNCRDRRCRCT